MSDSILCDFEILQARNNILARLNALSNALSQYQKTLQDFLDNGLKEGAAREAVAELLTESNTFLEPINQFEDLDIDAQTKQFFSLIEEIDKFLY